MSAIAARSHGAAQASSSRISASEGTASLRTAFLEGLALVPRKGLRRSLCRRSSHVQKADAPLTSSRTVAGALPAAFSASIQSSARAGVSSRGEMPSRWHQASIRASAAEYRAFVRRDPVRLACLM